MQVAESIQCLFCGQTFEVLFDTAVSSQDFTTDCEVCCRPLAVHAECEPGQLVSVEVNAG